MGFKIEKPASRCIKMRAIPRPSIPRSRLRPPPFGPSVQKTIAIRARARAYRSRRAHKSITVLSEVIERAPSRFLTRIDAAPEIPTLRDLALCIFVPGEED